MYREFCIYHQPKYVYLTNKKYIHIIICLKINNKKKSKSDQELITV